MAISDKITSIQNHLKDDWDSVESLIGDTELDKNIENISTALDDLYNDLPKVTGSGTSITLDDTRKGRLESSLKGNTSQDGTPTPTSPIPVNVVSGDNEIEVCGKNLLIPDTTTTRTSSGITSIINEDGSLTLTGTATANAYLKFTSDMTLESNTTYTTLNQNSILPNNVTMYYNSVGNIGSTYADTVISPGGRLKTYTTGEVNGTISIAILVQTGVTINTTLYPMLLKGTYTTSNIPTYEPYQGNAYNIDLPVENLLNLTNGTYTNNQGITATIENGKITLNGTGTTNPSGVTIPLTKTIIIPSNVAYNLSAFNGSTNSNVSLRLQAVESSNPYTNVTLSNINANATIQANEQYEVDRLYIRCNQGTTLSNFIIQPQIEKGSKVNSFTPYGTTPIELCKIGNYQDYFYKDSDKWYLHKEIGKIVLNGSESWQLQNSQTLTNTIYLTSNVIDNTLNNGATNGYSNYFQTGVSLWNNDIEGMQFSTSDRHLRLRISNTLAQGVATFQSWLSNNNVPLWYPLATPTNEEITYQPLIEQLNAIEKAQSKENQTNISQVNNDLPFIISASALLDASTYITQLEAQIEALS